MPKVFNLLSPRTPWSLFYVCISDVTLVDVTTVTWQTAVDAMNTAIGAWNVGHSDNPCDWTFRVNSGPARIPRMCC